MPNSRVDIITRRASGMTRQQVGEAAEKARYDARRASKYTQNEDDEKTAEDAHQAHQEWERIATAMDNHTMATYNPENDPIIHQRRTDHLATPTPPPLRPAAGPAPEPDSAIARGRDIIHTALGRTGLAYEMTEADHQAADQLSGLDEQLLHQLAGWLERARARGVADGASAQAVRDANRPRRRTTPEPWR